MAEPGGAKSKAKKKRERQKARKKEKQVAQKTAGGGAALQEKLAFSEPEPEPESEPKPEPQELLLKLTSEAPLGPMFEFGTAEVLQWLESVEGLTGKQRAAIKDRLEEDVHRPGPARDDRAERAAAAAGVRRSRGGAAGAGGARQICASAGARSCDVSDLPASVRRQHCATDDGMRPHFLRRLPGRDAAATLWDKEAELSEVPDGVLSAEGAGGRATGQLRHHVMCE